MVLDAVGHMELDPEALHPVRQRVRHLGVEEAQQPVTALGQRDPDAQRGEHAGVFAADDAAAGHEHRRRDFAEVQDVVRVIHARVVEGEIRRVKRVRASGDEHLVRVQVRRGRVARRDRDRVRVHERRETGVEVNAVALEVLHDARALGLHDEPLAVEKVARRERLLHLEMHRVQPALAEAGEVERRLAEGLGRQRAGIRRRAAEHGFLLDERDLLAEVSRLRCALLSSGAGADDHEVVMLGVHRSAGCGRCW